MKKLSIFHVLVQMYSGQCLGEEATVLLQKQKEACITFVRIKKFLSKAKLFAN